MVLKWDEQLLATIRANAPRTGPTVAARALGMLHTATYDAWEAYNPTARSTLPNGIPEPQPSSSLAAKSKAISYAAYRVLSDLFPFRRLSHYVPQMNALGYDPNDNSDQHLTPQGVGNVAAQKVIDFRHGDNSNQTRNDNGTPSNPDDDFNTYPDPACVPVHGALLPADEAVERPDDRPLEAGGRCACLSRRPDRPAAAERTAQRYRSRSPRSGPRSPRSLPRRCSTR